MKPTRQQTQLSCVYPSPPLPSISYPGYPPPLRIVGIFEEHVAVEHLRGNVGRQMLHVVGAKAPKELGRRIVHRRRADARHSKVELVHDGEKETRFERSVDRLSGKINRGLPNVFRGVTTPHRLPRRVSCVVTTPNADRWSGYAIFRSAGGWQRRGARGGTS